MTTHNNKPEEDIERNHKEKNHKEINHTRKANDIVDVK